jgi:hypothetical protein
MKIWLRMGITRRPYKLATAINYSSVHKLADSWGEDIHSGVRTERGNRKATQ